MRAEKSRMKRKIMSSRFANKDKGAIRKTFILGTLLAIIVAATVSFSPSIIVLADSHDAVSQQQLQEDLLKHKYPYSELPAGERVQLVQYEINLLNEQIIHFAPGQGTTMSYIQNTLTHMQELLPALSQGTLAAARVAGDRNSTSPVPVAINMPYYGSNSGGADLAIVNAHPAFLINNSAAGPWKGDANISKYRSAGIKYFEYLDGGYEGRFRRSIPNDLPSNLNYISAAARGGAYGIFLDEVSDGIYTTPNYNYLKAIANKAHSLGLKVVFCTGMPSWADQLMNYCDYLTSSETWQNTPLTASQSKWATRVWLLTYGINDATTAANLTKAAWSKGILAEYACYNYPTLPVWLDSYISQIRGTSVEAFTLAFTTQPSVNNKAGAAFVTQPVLMIEDASRKRITTSSASVTLSITAGTGTTGAAFSGTTTVSAVNGVATFSGLSINLVGKSYTVTATSSGLTLATSSSLNVSSSNSRRGGHY